MEVISKIDMIHVVPIDFYGMNDFTIVDHFNSQEECNDYINHFKMIFNILNDQKFDEIKHEYRYDLIDCIDYMDDDNKKSVLSA